ncbi:MAG: hypothetical protein MJA83_18925, partial [Gammaproteobacteria bacterium]|nr:hypothetical protein [Gammaproteobacteria bacterium]
MLGLTQNSHVGYLRLSTLLLLAWVVFSPSSTLFAAVETVAVSADNDDAEQLLNNGNMRLNSGALNIVGVNAVPQLLGIVFRNVNVDDTATICSAYIQFQARGVNPGTNPFDYDPANYTITAEAAGNPTAPIQNTNSYLSGLTKTTASVNWQPPEWLVNNQRGVDQRTADLTSIVNELIGTHGFTQNDNMLFLIEGQGSRLADSRNAGAAIGPELFIDYDSGAGCGSPTTVNTQVSNNNDDAEENLVSGAMTRGGNRLEIGTRNGGGNNKQIVGIRFQNVNVPRFAIINSADIDFTVRVTTPTPSTATVVRIFGEDID